MICPNCGRRNSAGATFCSRCRQRLPLASKLNGAPRRAVIVEPRGGGGGGALVLAVALIAGFLFVGGAAAIYLSQPPADPGDSNLIGDVPGSPTLPPFVQFTASPAPTPTPSFILLPSESLFPSPSGFQSPSPITTVAPGATGTPRPTRTPGTGPTNPPTPKPVVARFACAQRNSSTKIDCEDRSKGNPTQWAWEFGDGGTAAQPNPSHDYNTYGTFTVKLVVTGPGGTSTETHDVTLNEPATDPPPTTPPTESPTTTPPTAPPTAAPTETQAPDAPPSP